MVEMKIQEGLTELLWCATTTVYRSQALFDLKLWKNPKTGKNIDHWLDNIHKFVGFKPEFIISHTVDWASNDRASVDNL